MHQIWVRYKYRVLIALAFIILMPSVSVQLQRMRFCPTGDCFVADDFYGFLLLQMTVGVFLSGFLVSLDAFTKWSKILKIGFVFMAGCFVIGYCVFFNTLVVVNSSEVIVKDKINHIDEKFSVTDLKTIHIELHWEQSRYRTRCVPSLYLAKKDGLEVYIGVRQDEVRKYFTDNYSLSIIRTASCN